MPSCHGGRRAYTALLAVLVSCTMHGIAHAQPEQSIQSEQSAHKSEQSTQSMPSSLLPVDLETMAATPQLFPGAMTTQGEQGLEHGQKGEVHEEDLSQLVHSIGPQVRAHPPAHRARCTSGVGIDGVGRLFRRPSGECTHGYLQTSAPLFGPAAWVPDGVGATVGEGLLAGDDRI